MEIRKVQLNTSPSLHPHQKRNTNSDLLNFNLALSGYSLLLYIFVTNNRNLVFINYNLFTDALSPKICRFANLCLCKLEAF